MKSRLIAVAVILVSVVGALGLALGFAALLQLGGGHLGLFDAQLPVPWVVAGFVSALLLLLGLRPGVVSCRRLAGLLRGRGAIGLRSELLGLGALLMAALLPLWSVLLHYNEASSVGELGAGHVGLLNDHQSRQRQALLALDEGQAALQQAARDSAEGQSRQRQMLAELGSGQRGLEDAARNSARNQDEMQQKLDELRELIKALGQPRDDDRPVMIEARKRAIEKILGKKIAVDCTAPGSIDLEHDDIIVHFEPQTLCQATRPFRLVVDLKVQFDSCRFGMTQELRQKLARLTGCMSDLGEFNTVLIRGHADKIARFPCALFDDTRPITNNQQLSEVRARNVEEVIYKELHLSGRNILSVGEGDRYDSRTIIIELVDQDDGNGQPSVTEHFEKRCTEVAPD